MSRETFKEAIFTVVQALTNHYLNDSGRKLVIHYFNEADGVNSFEKAMSAIEKYFPDSLPAPDKRSRRLTEYLADLKEEADLWDEEQ